ncbi:MucR family transcriptional regulator [Methylobacterium sp. sgz302541]|uniref:MucR family transcriptional regulator n=1 Tax=unclassified Methylobacterium TaxID=2615210 RepID=UPI003D33280E
MDRIEHTAAIVSAYVSNNHIQPSEVPGLIAAVHATFSGLDQLAPDAEPEAQKSTPAQIRRSITPGALISFIDGRPYKTLKRHLTTNGLSFEDYKVRYGLPADYPAICAEYSATRSALARSLGLGQKSKPAAEAVEPDVPAALPSKRRGRPKKAAE